MLCCDLMRCDAIWYKVKCVPACMRVFFWCYFTLKSNFYNINIFKRQPPERFFDLHLITSFSIAPLYFNHITMYYLLPSSHHIDEGCNLSWRIVQKEVVPFVKASVNSSILDLRCTGFKTHVNCHASRISCFIPMEKLLMERDAMQTREGKMSAQKDNVW